MVSKLKDIVDAIKLNKKIGPKVLILSPTDYCNLECKTCWRLKKDATFNQPSFNFLKKIIEEAKKMGVEIIDLTGGGEPFIRKDVLELMELVKRLEMKGTITTNAILIKREDVDRIIEMGWDEINFSLDGSTPEINDNIRGKNTFENVLTTIRAFQESSSSKPVLRLSFTITRTNLDDIPNYIRLAKQLKIQNINFSTLFEWDSNKELWLKISEKKEIDQVLKKSLSLAKKLSIKTNLEAVATFGLWNHNPPKFCFAPWHMLFVNANGEAMVCCTLASLYQNKLGEVKSLSETWHGKKMESMRKRMKNKIFFKECKRCLPEFTQAFNQMYGEMKNGT
jgi:radical SAM protein with 4Fe4S-binding SPASM domain